MTDLYDSTDPFTTVNDFMRNPVGEWIEGKLEILFRTVTVTPAVLGAGFSALTQDPSWVCYGIAGSSVISCAENIVSRNPDDLDPDVSTSLSLRIGFAAAALAGGIGVDMWPIFQKSGMSGIFEGGVRVALPALGSTLLALLSSRKTRDCVVNGIVDTYSGNVPGGDACPDIYRPGP